MAVLPILTQEAPILRQKAKRVPRVDSSIRRLIDDMVDTMVAAPGVGLAAPQVGVGLRVVVIKTDTNLHTLVNPEMVKWEGEQIGLEGRGLKLLQSGIKRRALQLDLEVFQPERIRDDAAQSRIRQAGAEVMVVVAYGQILPASLITAPRLGTLNVHASLLPRHRGPAPIDWSILSG